MPYRMLIIDDEAPIRSAQDAAREGVSPRGEGRRPEYARRPRGASRLAAVSVVIATIAAYAARALTGRLDAAHGGAWTMGLVGGGIPSSACRIALIALVVSGMAAIPAAAQAGATAVVSATVVDLREARATVQAAHGLAAGLAAGHATSLAGRGDLPGATVFVSLREHAVPGRSPDAAIATVIYW